MTTPATPVSTADLRKAAKAVYAATEKDVADDLSRLLVTAADEIETLRSRTERAQAALKGPRPGENVLRWVDRAIATTRKTLAGEDDPT